MTSGADGTGDQPLTEEEKAKNRARWKQSMDKVSFEMGLKDRIERIETTLAMLMSLCSDWLLPMATEFRKRTAFGSALQPGDIQRELEELARAQQELRALAVAMAEPVPEYQAMLKKQWGMT